MLTKTRGSERFVFRSHPKIPQSLELWKRTQGGSREQKHRAAGLSRSGRLFSPRECQALGTVRTAGPAPWWAAMGPHTPPASAPFSPPPSAVLESFDTTRAWWSLGHLGKVTSAFGFLGNRELAPLCRPHRDAVKTSGLNLRKGYLPINCRAVSRGKAAGAGSQGMWL